MVDIKSMSWEELEELRKAIEAEKRERDERRFQELAQAAADALNAIKMEYPWVRLEFEVQSEDFGDMDVNLFDHFEKFTARKFMKA